MSEWQPIETAPKDGTDLLLWWPYWSKIPVHGYWSLGEWASLSAISEGDGPTHWMPLPAPPTEGSDA
jgi:hypothetical protein